MRATKLFLTELSPKITKYFHQQGKILVFPHAYLQTPEIIIILKPTPVPAKVLSIQFNFNFRTVCA